MKKIIGKLVVLVIILVIVTVGLGILLIDPLLKAGIQKGATYALDVDTKVKNVDMQLVNGRLIIEDLNVANPDDFKTPHFMDMSRFDIQVKTSSLLSDEILINNFELDGLDLNIEQKLSGSNVKAILNNLKRFEKEPSAPQEPKEPQKPAEGKGKKLRVDKIVIKDVVAHFHLLSDLTSGGGVTVKVPEIVLNDVTPDEAGGLMIEQLISRIIPAILAAVVEKAEGLVPGDFLKDIDSQVKDLAKALGSSAEVILKQGTANLKEVGEKLKSGEGLKGAGEKLDEIKKDAGSLLKGVLGEKKEEPAE